MPELPEVEVIRRTVWPGLEGRTVVAASVSESRLPQNLSPDELERKLLGKRFVGSERRGKYLLFTLSGDAGFVLHLRMTGQLLLRPAEAARKVHVDALRTGLTDVSERIGVEERRSGVEQFDRHPHTRLILQLDRGWLVFRDQRRFATLHWSENGDFSKFPFLTRLGPEPLASSFTVDALGAGLRRRRAAVKAVLLDQSCVAGLGNIYADEALHRARICPHQLAAELEEDDVLRLHTAIVEVLQEALEQGGTTIRDYRTGSGESGYFQVRLNVYGREGEPCLSCSSPITRGKVAGRSTWFCTRCQPA